MALPEQKNLNLDPISIAYREKGSGTPLVFIHGMGGNSAAWKGQYSAFADGYRVIGWDSPGYGDSGEFTDDRPVVADYVDALARLFDGLGIEAAHLAGHSLGGIIVCARPRADPGGHGLRPGRRGAPRRAKPRAQGRTRRS